MSDFSCSKPLENPDNSAFDFTKRIFGNKSTYMVNFDSIMNHPKYGYIVLEYCKVSEDWLNQGISPWESNPKKYWPQNKRKFLAIWEYTKAINGRLWIINYADEDEDFEHPDDPPVYKDRVKIIEALAISSEGFINSVEHRLNFDDFQKFMIVLNEECGESDVVNRFSQTVQYSELSNIEVSVSIDVGSSQQDFRGRISDLYYGIKNGNGTNTLDVCLPPATREKLRNALFEKAKDLNSAEGRAISSWLQQCIVFPPENNGKEPTIDINSSEYF